MLCILLLGLEEKNKMQEELKPILYLVKEHIT